MTMNRHVFKGHKTLLGNKFVTYGEVELPTRYDIFPKSKTGFDWGHNGPASMQLSFAILYQVSNEETAQRLVIDFTKEVVKLLNSRDWVLSATDVHEWLESKVEDEIEVKQAKKKSNLKQAKEKRVRKDNVVKSTCKELNITQKQLAEILEVPEGTVSSWAVKNEIPRLGKKAIEFYKTSAKNQKIVDSYKDFIHLLQAS
jgi:DNA-binding transcriptional regulator YiaG